MSNKKQRKIVKYVGLSVIIFIFSIIGIYIYFNDQAKKSSIEFCENSDQIKNEIKILELLKNIENPPYVRYSYRRINTQDLPAEEIKYTSVIDVKYTGLTPSPIYLCFMQFKDGVLVNRYAVEY